MREIDDDEGRRLVRIVRRGNGSVVMDVVEIAKVAFTSDDRVRYLIHNFNSDSFASLYPKYKCGRAPKFTLPECREIKKIAKSKPAEHDLSFSAWSQSKLAQFLVVERWSTTSATRDFGCFSAGRASRFNA